MVRHRTRGVARGRLFGLVCAGAAVVLVGCVGGTGGTATTTPAASDVLDVVALGDSIPFNSPQDCPGCTGFVDSFADALAATRGQPVEVTNRSRDDDAQSSDIREQVRSGYVDNVIGGADVVIVSAGLYDQPPYADEGEACSAAELDNEADAVAALLATTPDCIATRTATAAKQLEGALEGVRERVPDATILVLTPYNSWTGKPALDAEGPDAAAAVTSTVVAALEEWRAAACEAAATVDGECVDLLTAFNGPDGTTPAGDLLAADYTHPSQAGNDLIRDLLLAAETG